MIMKKYLLMFLIIVASLYLNNMHAKNYAILVSAGQTVDETDQINATYWYDLYLAYETLLNQADYDSTNVFVFYGDGNDYNSRRNRYKLEYNSWGSITDYDNSYETLDSVMTKLGDVITYDDNFLFYWVAGHANCNGTPDTYTLAIENQDTIIDKESIIKVVDKIDKYKRRKILWMTCYSGAIGFGEKSLLNDKTVILTSSNYNNLSFPFTDTNGEHHSTFNFAVYSLLQCSFPNGQSCTIDSVTHNRVTNIDGLLSFYELYKGIDNFNYKDKITSISFPMINPITPRLFSLNNMAHDIFLNENNNIVNVNLENEIFSYRMDRVRINNVSLRDTSFISFNADDNFVIDNSFFVESGSTLIIK